MKRVERTPEEREELILHTMEVWKLSGYAMGIEHQNNGSLRMRAQVLVATLLPEPVYR